MSKGAVARSYGRALFEAAREAGILPRVLDEAAALEQAWRTELPDLLLSPKVPLARRLEVVREVFAGASPLFLSFLELVIRKGRAGALPEMTAVLRQLDHQAAGRAMGRLESAVPLPEPLQEEIRVLMARLTGREPTLAARVDPELLGGFTARVGDQLLDLSLRTRLERLRRHLRAV
jgi:F-type H+-transporting ATPase subunit delta